MPLSPCWRASVLLLMTALVAHAVDLKPYAGPEAVLQDVDLQRRLAFWRSITVEAYQARGSTDVRFDDDVVKLLEIAAADSVGAAHPHRLTGLSALTDPPAGRGGSRDPLVAWARYQLTSRGDRKVALKNAKAAWKALEDDAKAQPGGIPRYAHLLMVYPINFCLERYGRTQRKPADHEQALATAKALAIEVAATITAGECAAAPTSLIRMARNLALNHPDFSEPIVAAIDAALRDARTEAWLADAVKARIRIDNAWAWRGSGWASTVTEEGWKQFQRNLVDAERFLLNAYALNPREPMLGVMGITLANTTEHAVSTEEWLRRSVAACFDHMDAYDAVRNFQLPRWGGSYDAMLALGCDGVDTGRFDTDVPWLLVKAMAGVISDAQRMDAKPDMQKSLAKEAIDQALTACLLGYTARHPKRAAHHRIIRVAYLWHAGRHADARVLLEGMPRESLEPGTARWLHIDYAAILGRGPGVSAGPAEDF